MYKKTIATFIDSNGKLGRYSELYAFTPRSQKMSRGVTAAISSAGVGTESGLGFRLMYKDSVRVNQ